MYLLAKRLLRTDKKYTKVSEYRSRWLKIKTLNSLQIIKKLGQRFFLLVRHFCCVFFERNPFFFLFAQSYSLSQLLYSVYKVPLTDAMWEVFKKHNQRSHLGKTIDALIIGDSF